MMPSNKKPPPTVHHDHKQRNNIISGTGAATRTKPAAGFNENDARYMCCSRRHHVRRAALIVAIVELAAVCIVIGCCTVAYLLNGFYKTPTRGIDPVPGKRSLLILSLAMSIISVVIWTIVVCCTAWGVRKCRSGWLIPHMMIQILAVVSLAGLATLFVWWVVDLMTRQSDTTSGDRNNVAGERAGAGAGPNGSHDREESRNVPNYNDNDVLVATIVFVSAAIACTIGCFVEIYFFIVLRRCYKYISAKVAYNSRLQTQQQRGNCFSTTTRVPVQQRL